MIGIWVAFTSSFVSGLWIAFTGWFLENAASSSQRQQVLQDALRGIKVRNVMAEECSRVPVGISVSQLVHDYVMPMSRRCLIVTDDERFVGMVTLHNIKELNKDEWENHTVAEIMTPAEKLLVATPDEDVANVLQRMDMGDINQMPVMEKGAVIGMIAREHLLRLIALRSELKV
jgi:predicted transcriptional regulator